MDAVCSAEIEDACGDVYTVTKFRDDVETYYVILEAATGTIPAMFLTVEEVVDWFLDRYRESLMEQFKELVEA